MKFQKNLKLSAEDISAMKLDLGAITYLDLSKTLTLFCFYRPISV